MIEIRKLIPGALLFALALIVLAAVPVAAQDESEPAVSNEQCMLCHSEPGLTMVLPSNEVLPLTVDHATLQDSVHGELNCTECHNDKVGYPHGPFPETDYRSWQIEMSQVCGNCHEPEALLRQDSVHARLLAAGRMESATCTDCHGSHDVQWANPESGPVDREAQVEACGNCHSIIAAGYSASVHGQSLAEGNEDVPICSTCHPAHHIEDPRSAEFRLNSPNLCGDCHADSHMMAQYHISTDVFDTYVTDFHGTTVQIFENTQPGAVTNKAVCSDCHGAHLILPATDEHSSTMQANLLLTCQRCHPDANESFTSSWMGHFRPSWENFPFVTAVEWFYKIVIPVTVTFFIGFISLDLGRTWLNRSRQRREFRRIRRDEEQKMDGGEQ